MQDEQLDNLINEAASQHHPPYNDKAWDKMQAKLDAHLAEKNWDGSFFYYYLLVEALFMQVVFSVLKTGTATIPLYKIILLQLHLLNR